MSEFIVIEIPAGADHHTAYDYFREIAHSPEAIKHAGVQLTPQRVSTCNHVELKDVVKAIKENDK